MLADAEAAGMALDGAGGLLAQMNKAVLERALGAEPDDHLGYVRGDPAGNGPGNSRNGHYAKTVTTMAGPVRIAVPRDRNSATARRYPHIRFIVAGTHLTARNVTSLNPPRPDANSGH